MKKRIFFILLILLALPGLSLSAEDQGNIKIRINQIISENFPNVEVYLAVTRNDGVPITELDPSNFTVFVDTLEVKDKIQVQPFFLTEAPVSYYLLLDGSGIMDGNPIYFQRQAAKEIFDKLKKKTEKEPDKAEDLFSLFVFSEEPTTVFEHRFPEDTIMSDDIPNKINVVEGFAPKLYDAIVHVTRRMEAESEAEHLKELPTIRRKVMIICSDGRNQDSRFTKDEVNAKITQLNYPVYTIGFSVIGGGNLNNLETMSNITGGSYLYANSLNNIPLQMKTAMDQIQKGIVLRFNINEIQGDDENHELKIVVKEAGGANEGSFFKKFNAPIVPFPLWAKILIAALCVLLLAGIILTILLINRKERAQMGITKRKCPDCRRRMKDDWDECVFCKYIPPQKKKAPKE